MIWKHFTTRDIVSRRDVLQAHARATATQFLDSLQQRMAFRIRAVQVDCGSKFAADFRQAHQQRGRHVFVLPPRSPKTIGAVDRVQRTHTEKSYQVTNCALEKAALDGEPREWEKPNNTVRPHQFLGYRTPAKYLEPWHAHPKD